MRRNRPAATATGHDLVRCLPFTRAEWELLPEKFPAVLVDGMLLREPAPTWPHQGLVAELNALLRAAAPGRVLFSPIDVAIDDQTVLQPDVLVGPEGMVAGRDGHPDVVPVLVVEVLSPSTAARDRRTKSAAYLRRGVAEVWLIDPALRRIEVATEDGVAAFPEGERATSSAVPGFTLAWPDLEGA